ncbi:MAG: hypothetical protein R3B84_05470 [Zavarzinella sp.]
MEKKNLFPGEFVVQLLFCLLVIPNFSFADEKLQVADDNFVKGLENAHQTCVAKGHFQVAAQFYAEIFSKKPSTHVALRWGDSHRMLNQPAEAIRAYRSGLRKFPLSAELWAALCSYRSRLGTNNTVKNEEILIVFQMWYPRLRWLQFVIPITMAFLVWRWWYRRNPILFGAWVGLGICYLIAILLHEYIFIRAKAYWEPPAVVVKSEIPLRTGNGDEFPKINEGNLQIGAEMSLIHQRGEWVQVRTNLNETGWVHQKNILIID